MRVLLVEDEPETAKLLAKGLDRGRATRWMWRSTAWTAAASSSPRICDDLALRHAAGVEWLQLQQQIRKLGETPVLFLTTKDGIEDRLRGRAA